MRLSTPHGHHFFGHGFFNQHSFFGRDLYGETGLHHGWLAALGVMYLLLGFLGLGMVSIFTLASVLFFGVLLLAGGLVQLVLSFTSRGRRNVLAGALLGLLYMFAGVVTLYNPLVTSMMLTLFLAGALIVLGVLRITFSLQHRTYRYWIWSVVSGVISVLLGLLIIAEWPVTGLWVIGLFVSLEMIFHGASSLALAVEKRRLI